MSENIKSIANIENIEITKEIEQIEITKENEQIENTKENEQREKAWEEFMASYKKDFSEILSNVKFDNSQDKMVWNRLPLTDDQKIELLLINNNIHLII